MATRPRPAALDRGESPAEGRAALPSQTDLPELTDRLLQAPSEAERVPLRTLLARLLQSRATVPATAAEASALLQLLDAKALDDALDAGGISVRARAVARVVKSGYPHALALAPEDVEHWTRAQDARRRNLWTAAGLGTGAMTLMGAGLAEGLRGLLIGGGVLSLFALQRLLKSQNGERLEDGR